MKKTQTVETIVFFNIFKNSIILLIIFIYILHSLFKHIIKHARQLFIETTLHVKVN